MKIPLSFGDKALIEESYLMTHDLHLKTNQMEKSGKVCGRFYITASVRLQNSEKGP